MTVGNVIKREVAKVTHISGLQRKLDKVSKSTQLRVMQLTLFLCYLSFYFESFGLTDTLSNIKSVRVFLFNCDVKSFGFDSKIPLQIARIIHHVSLYFCSLRVVVAYLG